MNHIGQAITWGTRTAPRLFGGICSGYHRGDTTSRQLVTTTSGANCALILHSRRVPIFFSARVTNESTDFLDLSKDAAISVSGISSGVIIATQATERWALGQQKEASAQAVWFPDVNDIGGGHGGTLSAFTPDQSGLGIVSPGGVIIWGTYGLSHASGLVHALTIQQSVKITQDDPTPDGRLVSVATSGYQRTIALDVLSQADAPEVQSVLSLSGAPDHAADYRIESCHEVFGDKRGKMYAIEAVWIPPFSGVAA